MTRPQEGWDASRLVEWLVASLENVESVEILAFHPAASLVKRTGHQDRDYRLTPSMAPADSLWFPKHQAVMIDLVEHGFMSCEFLSKAVWHDENGGDTVRETVKRTEFHRRRLEEFAARHPQWILAMSSKVRLRSGETRHLPLLDFQCPAAKSTYLAAVVDALRAIGQTEGAVLESGNSFHYYGFQLLPVDRWHWFVGKCLLLSPLSDTRYLGHRLIAGESALRISLDPSRPIPKVVALLRPAKLSPADAEERLGRADEAEGHEE